ncbi:ABC transporter permease [Paenibacillus sp. WC2504]|uniref:ABC transporter permease n=1 Tax=Paenibacillus sp. WC2504 TaxID=3461403 RepID=UPI004045433B
MKLVKNMDRKQIAENRNAQTGVSLAASFRRTIAKDLFLYALVAPGLLYFLIFKYVPMWGVMISFQNYSPFLGFFKSEWVGFEHFARLFSNADFYMLFRNTMAINVLSLVFFFPLPIIVALLLNELQTEWFKKTLQSVVYLPHFLSWVVIVGLSLLLLSKEHGVLNQLLELVGWGPIEFLTEPKYFWALLTGQTIWKELGWGTVIFLAAIAGVDPQLYEAAKMDGAGRIRMMWNVTLPSIRNVIIILLILRIGHMMDVGFEQVFLMMNGAVADVAEVFDTYVFRVGIKQGDFSYSTAVGLFKSIVGLVLVIGANKLSKKFGEEGVY